MLCLSSRKDGLKIQYKRHIVENSPIPVLRNASLSNVGNLFSSSLSASQVSKPPVYNQSQSIFSRLCLSYAETEVKWVVYPFVLAQAAAAASRVPSRWCFKIIVQEVTQESPPFLDLPPRVGCSWLPAAGCHQNKKWQSGNFARFQVPRHSPARGMFNGMLIPSSNTGPLSKYSNYSRARVCYSARVS